MIAESTDWLCAVEAGASPIQLTAVAHCVPIATWTLKELRHVLHAVQGGRKLVRGGRQHKGPHTLIGSVDVHREWAGGSHIECARNMHCEAHSPWVSCTTEFERSPDACWKMLAIVCCEALGEDADPRSWLHNALDRSPHNRGRPPNLAGVYAALCTWKVD
eukprot:5806622-Prymnesium_polylepis.1